MTKRITTLTLAGMKENKEKITMATAYDYASAKVADDAGMEMILVGDSLGMVVLGYENTLGVTLAEMIHHGKAVVRAAKRAMVVIDLPFMTYQVTKEDALRNAGRAIQETGAPAVKLEGGEEMAKTVEKIVRAGIPVVGHIGLTPQSVGQMGGFVVQGKNERMARQLLKDALALEDAGACAVVLEGIPWQLGQLITEKITIPTIGIGAGVYCDGQVLVYHDILGLQTELRPKFVKQFGQFYHPMVDAMRAYAKEVKDAAFPAPEHTFTMDENIIERLREKF
ncbi:MAG: 3-methyl-2-oxobutanoate hydroxymethyltransferase [Dethiobacter sp.]|nr:3-methyl-2-oxobutanoate hydroxymethyltransferase [Dethiobacter sp.]MBS3899727.1 3-methyl-2-oxobutanoate hydroxymethyltransferase [Dethiobacter sp.]